MQTPSRAQAETQAVIQQVHMMLMLSVWKRTVAGVLGYLVVPAAAFAAMTAQTGSQGMGMIALLATLPLVHAAVGQVKDTPVEEIAERFATQQGQAEARRFDLDTDQTAA